MQVSCMAIDIIIKICKNHFFRNKNAQGIYFQAIRKQKWLQKRMSNKNLWVCI